MSPVAGRVAGSLVALAVVSTGTLGMVGVFLEHQRDLSSTVVASRLVVTDDVGDVRVRVAALGQPITVVRTLHWSLRPPADSTATVVAPSQPDGTATVDGRCDGGGFAFERCRVDLDITMPAATDLEVSITAGDVRVDGAAGSLQVRTSAGDVTATNLRTRSPVLEAGAGDLTARFAQAPDSVRVRTLSGDVVIALPPGTDYLVHARTVAGDHTVQVRTSPVSTHVVDASTQAGDVSVVTDPPPA
jgi:hypothetical protein